MIIKEKAVVCLTNEPVPIAYLNVYEEGDVWVKIKGCENCPLEKRKICCGQCVLFTEKGCLFHLQDNGRQKPFHCIVNPIPSETRSWCQLEFRCIAGSKKGKIRKINKPGNVFD